MGEEIREIEDASWGADRLPQDLRDAIRKSNEIMNTPWKEVLENVAGNPEGEKLSNLANYPNVFYVGQGTAGDALEVLSAARMHYLELKRQKIKGMKVTVLLPIDAKTIGDKYIDPDFHIEYFGPSTKQIFAESDIGLDTKTTREYLKLMMNSGSLMRPSSLSLYELFSKHIKGEKEESHGKTLIVTNSIAASIIYSQVPKGMKSIQISAHLHADKKLGSDHLPKSRLMPNCVKYKLFGSVAHDLTFFIPEESTQGEARGRKIYRRYINNTPTIFTANRSLMKRGARNLSTGLIGLDPELTFSDEVGEENLFTKLDEWKQEGKKVIVVAFGSMYIRPSSYSGFIDNLRAAIHGKNIGVVYIGGWSDPSSEMHGQGETNDNAEIYIPFVNYNRIFSRTEVLAGVLAGGMGTLATALKHGISPLLIGYALPDQWRYFERLKGYKYNAKGFPLGMLTRPTTSEKTTFKEALDETLSAKFSQKEIDLVMQQQIFSYNEHPGVKYLKLLNFYLAGEA